MLTWGELRLLKLGMDRLGHRLIGRRGSGCGHMGDQVRGVFLACLSEVDFVAGPPRLALLAIACLWIRGRVDELVARRKIVVASPVELPFDPDVVLDPNAAQDLDCQDFTRTLQEPAQQRDLSTSSSHLDR